MHSNYNLLTLSDSRLLNSNGQMIYYKERIEGRNIKNKDKTIEAEKKKIIFKKRP